MVELESARSHSDTSAKIMAGGSGSEAFATTAYRELMRSLDQARTKHGLLFIGQRHIGTFMLSAIAAFIGGSVASDSGASYGSWIMILGAVMFVSPFLGYLVPYTQFDNSRLKTRVRVFNWFLLGIALYGLKAGLEQLFRG